MQRLTYFITINTTSNNTSEQKGWIGTAMAILNIQYFSTSTLTHM